MRYPLLALAVLLAACGPATGGSSPSPQSETVIPSPTPYAGPLDVCHRAIGVTRCVLNPAVTQATLGGTICKPGWTASVRPAQQYTGALKAQQMRQLSLPGSASNYEEDHRLPLELGGAPRDPYNLSPEIHPGSIVKDADENGFKKRVCSGESLSQAQSEFIAKWLGPWPSYLGG